MEEQVDERTGLSHKVLIDSKDIDKRPEFRSNDNRDDSVGFRRQR